MFKPCQILLFDKNGPFDLMGFVLSYRQGDTTKTHGAMIAEDPNYIWTTGAKKRLTWKPPFVQYLYGRVPVKEYIKNRTYTVVDFIDPLTAGEIKIVEEMHKKWENQPYGLNKVMKLLSIKRSGQFVDCLTEPPETPDTIKNPFCTEAVSGCSWKVDRPVCKELGKRAPDAITPENLDVAARYKEVIKLADNQPGERGYD